MEEKAKRQREREEERETAKRVKAAEKEEKAAEKAEKARAKEKQREQCGSCCAKFDDDAADGVRILQVLVVSNLPGLQMQR